MLDRLNQLLPGWSGSASEADLGVVLAELIAYVGDHLSYQQDAVATEAYLETARRRVSLRRHALLVDYHVHDGCNARAWIQLTVSGNAGDAVFLDRTVTRFYTFAPGMPASLAVGARQRRSRAIAGGVQVFEPMHDAVLFPEHNQMRFYTWGDTNCCLPKGATEATLLGTFPARGRRRADLPGGQGSADRQSPPTPTSAIAARCGLIATVGDLSSIPLFKDGGGQSASR